MSIVGPWTQLLLCLLAVVSQAKRVHIHGFSDTKDGVSDDILTCGGFCKPLEDGCSFFPPSGYTGGTQDENDAFCASKCIPCTFCETNSCINPHQHIAHWHYNDVSVWSDDFPDCAGSAQSPINIDLADVGGTSTETIASLASYHPLAWRSILNDGHGEKIAGKFGTLTLPDGIYDVLQFHFHFPSEHKFNGKLLDGELHIVHQKQGSHGTNDLAVVGIMLAEIGGLSKGHNKSSQMMLKKESQFLDKLMKELPREPDHSVNEGFTVDLNNFDRVLNRPFLHYKGSLTTPPCSETVHWYVLQQPAAVSKQVIAAFKDIFPSPMNNRPTQPLNTRTVTHELWTAADSD